MGQALVIDGQVRADGGPPPLLQPTREVMARFGETSLGEVQRFLQEVSCPATRRVRECR